MDRPYGHPKLINRPVAAYPFEWDSAASSKKANEALSYRQHIARLRSIYPRSRVIQELYNFFFDHIDRQRYQYATQVTIAEFVHGDEYGDVNLQTTCTAEDLRELVGSASRKGRGTSSSTRIILLEYESKRSLDRDILDVLGSEFAINPTFLYKHVTLNRYGSGVPFFRSEEDGMELKMQRNFISSLICRGHVDSGLELDTSKPSTGMEFWTLASILLGG